MNNRIWTFIALILAILAGVLQLVNFGGGASFYLVVVALILHIVGTLTGE